MAVFRKVKKTDYTVIDNNIFKNKNLTLKGKGLLCTMLSLPDDWEFSEEGLASISNTSRTCIRSTLDELMEYGYLTRKRNRDSKGRLTDTEYTIYEEPMYQKPTLVKPTLEKPMLEKEHNKILNNKVSKNKINIFVPPTLDEVKDYCLNVRHNSVDYQKFYDFYSVGEWKDSKGNKIKNWKQKVITWESKEPKKKKEIVYETI